MVATSWSHTPERPRWRVYAPLSLPHTPLACERFVAALDAILGGILTTESYTLSQSYYVDFPENGHRQVLPTFGDPEEGVCIDDLETLDELAGAIDVDDDERPRKGSRAELHEHRRRARDWIRGLPGGEPCRYVGQLAADAMAAARREGHNQSAHIDTGAVLFALLRAGERGHPGVRGVLERVRPVFVDTVTTKRASPPSVTEAEGEFGNLELDAAVKIMAEPGEFAGWGCDCGDEPRVHHDGRRTDNASADDEEEDGWPESPRVPGPPEPEPIPLEGLPAALLETVQTVAAGTQTAPAFVFWQALGCISTALRGRYDVRVDDRPWTETGVLDPIPILPTGARKSPPFKLLTRSIARWELDQRDRIEESRRYALDRVRQCKAALEREIRRGGQGLEAENAIKKARDALTTAERAVPVLPRVRVGDTTSEALALLMRDQGGSIGLIAPEGDPLKCLAGRYDDGHHARLELLKMGYDRETYIRDRVKEREDPIGLETMEELQPVVRKLVDRGCIRLRGQPPTGGRPASPIVEIHPTLRREQGQKGHKYA